MLPNGIESCNENRLLKQKNVVTETMKQKKVANKKVQQKREKLGLEMGM